MNSRAAYVCLLLLLSGCAGLFRLSGPEDFIRVQGTRLMHDGRPYYFIGANLWYGLYLGSPGPEGDRERLRRELDSLSDIGITNLRVLAASESAFVKRTPAAIQRRRGVVDEQLLEGLDFLLAEMAERRMHAVLYLNNYWEWSGGMSVYNVWAGKDTVDPDRDPGGWKRYMDFCGEFYSDRTANRFYRDYVRYLIERRNTVNGRNYRDDPTIMAWQLANEPRPGAAGEFGEQNMAEYVRWIDETAGFIHSLDTNHLVSTGSEGTVGSLLSADHFLAAHESRSIDYLTFHLWPLNWGWFDPRRIAETLPTSLEEGGEYVRQHISMARELRRPIVLEEFGLARDSGAYAPGTPVTARDRFFASILQIVYDSASAGGAISGANVWAWGGEEYGRHPDFIWQEGDPFLGDPPREPQGLNSVFLSDTSTIGILRRFAKEMGGIVVDSSLVYYGIRSGARGGDR